MGLGRRWVLWCALVVGAVAATLFLQPVLAAPVAGDDRVWYPELGSLESWSVTDDVAQLPEWWEQRTHSGRVNVVTILERRAAARAVIETSVGTGTPTYVVNGALKLLLAASAVLTLAALLKSLRRRRRDGVLVRLSGRTVLLGTLTGTVLFALGGQSPFHEVNGRNGWVTYPTHTYGAVVSILGVTALVLWLARLYAEGRARTRIPIVLGLVLLAVVTNLRYELVFPAAPLTLVALLLVPVTSADRAAAGRRARWVTGTAFVGVFLVVLVVLRTYLHRLCGAETCYLGVTPNLSWAIADTLWQNVLGSVPGTTAGRVADFVESQGVSPVGMYTPTAWSAAVALALAGALLAGWWAARRTPEAQGLTDDGIATDADESRLLVLAAGLCVLAALGAAAVMSLSVNAQTTAELGLPYRHTVITWAGLAWAVGLGALALRSRRPRVATATWAALAMAVAVAAACLLPANQRSLEADRVDARATEAAFAALVAGDLGDEADTARCALLPAIMAERVDAAEYFDAAFQRRWGQAFCRE